jgi:hypothetical protein
MKYMDPEIQRMRKDLLEYREQRDTYQKQNTDINQEKAGTLEFISVGILFFLVIKIMFFTENKSNKTLLQYEKKRWYRIVKSMYLSLFVLIFAIYNLVIVSEVKEGFFLWFISGNAIIIFAMGISEGLFWYIATGKWGKPSGDNGLN